MQKTAKSGTAILEGGEWFDTECGFHAGVADDQRPTTIDQEFAASHDSSLHRTEPPESPQTRACRPGVPCGLDCRTFIRLGGQTTDYSSIWRCRRPHFESRPSHITMKGRHYPSIKPPCSNSQILFPDRNRSSIHNRRISVVGTTGCFANHQVSKSKLRVYVHGSSTAKRTSGRGSIAASVVQRSLPAEVKPSRLSASARRAHSTRTSETTPASSLSILTFS